MAALRDTLLPLLAAAVITVAAALLFPGTTPAARDAVNAVAVFTATAAWDVVLRDLSTGGLRVLGAEKWGWVRDLRPYFQAHGIVGAASIAGAVGVLGYAVIRLYRPGETFLYIAWVLAVSAVVGLPMRARGWFTELQRHYYDRRKWLTVGTDAMSGLIVMVTVKGAGHMVRLL